MDRLATADAVEVEATQIPEDAAPATVEPEGEPSRDDMGDMGLGDVIDDDEPDEAATPESSSEEDVASAGANDERDKQVFSDAPAEVVPPEEHRLRAAAPAVKVRQDNRR